MHILIFIIGLILGAFGVIIFALCAAQTDTDRNRDENQSRGSEFGKQSGNFSRSDREERNDR